MLSLSSLLRVCLPNNRSAFHHSDFVSSAISDLVNLGLIVNFFCLPQLLILFLFLLIQKGRPDSSSICVMLTNIYPKPNIEWKTGKFFFNMFCVGDTCLSLT